MIGSPIVVYIFPLGRNLNAIYNTPFIKRLTLIRIFYLSVTCKNAYLDFLLPQKKSVTGINEVLNNV